jgi:hypothetical protein
MASAPNDSKPRASYARGSGKAIVSSLELKTIVFWISAMAWRYRIAAIVALPSDCRRI